MGRRLSKKWRLWKRWLCKEIASILNTLKNVYLGVLWWLFAILTLRNVFNLIEGIAVSEEYIVITLVTVISTACVAIFEMHKAFIKKRKRGIKNLTKRMLKYKEKYKVLQEENADLRKKLIDAEATIDILSNSPS